MPGMAWIQLNPSGKHRIGIAKKNDIVARNIVYIYYSKIVKLWMIGGSPILGNPHKKHHIAIKEYSTYPEDPCMEYLPTLTPKVI